MDREKFYDSCFDILDGVVKYIPLDRGWVLVCSRRAMNVHQTFYDLASCCSMCSRCLKMKGTSATFVKIVPTNIIY